MVSPSARRRAVKMSLEEGIGKVAAACRTLGLSRSSYYRGGRSSLESRRIRKEVLELSAKHPRYGYRRITALMRREGFEVNVKRVARIRREEGIIELLHELNYLIDQVSAFSFARFCTEIVTFDLRKHTTRACPCRFHLVAFSEARFESACKAAKNTLAQ